MNEHVSGTRRPSLTCGNNVRGEAHGSDDQVRSAPTRFGDQASKALICRAVDSSMPLGRATALLRPTVRRMTSAERDRHQRAVIASNKRLDKRDVGLRAARRR
jgi:hypothetical protein